jgi:glutathione S-transferase
MQRRCKPRWTIYSGFSERACAATLQRPVTEHQGAKPVLTVHHLETSRSQRVLWLLEELGVPYELKVYRRNPTTRLAPEELKAVHPLGKSPVITDDGEVIAESGAIIEYLVESYGQGARAELAQLQPPTGTREHRQCRYWMHYAEGSLMNWLVMKLVFSTLPTRPMPFFARPIARALCGKVQAQLIDPNLQAAVAFLEDHLARNQWFAGPHLTMADFQMSFAVEALLSRAEGQAPAPNLRRYLDRMRARPAYQRAEAKGGPVLMARA